MSLDWDEIGTLEFVAHEGIKMIVANRVFICCELPKDPSSMFQK